MQSVKLVKGHYISHVFNYTIIHLYNTTLVSKTFEALEIAFYTLLIFLSLTLTLSPFFFSKVQSLAKYE